MPTPTTAESLRAAAEHLAHALTWRLSPAKASEALTYNGRAGKQQEKNGARLTDAQN